MPLNEILQHLNKLKEMLPSVLSEISDEALHNNLENTVQSLTHLAPLAKKNLNDYQELVDAFRSWQKENKRLQGALSSFGVVLSEAPAIPVSGKKVALDEITEETAKDDEEEIVKDDEEEIVKDDEEETVKDDEEEAAKDDEEEIAKDDEEEIAKDDEEEATKDGEEEIAKDDEEVFVTRVDVNSLNEQGEFLAKTSADFSESLTENEKPRVTISTPQKHFDVVENIYLYLSEDEVMQELQVDLTGLKEMVKQKKLIPTVINDKNYFSKKKVSLLRSVAMESSTIVIEKPVKQPMNIFGSKNSNEASNKENLKDYFNENEVMEELQIDLASLKEMMEQKKLIPTVIDNKNYFSKRKVFLLRSMAMELSTIVIQKPKKKSPLSFWKDK